MLGGGGEGRFCFMGAGIFLREAPMSTKSLVHKTGFPLSQRIAKGAGKKVPRENCRKVSKKVLTLFDVF